MTDNNEKRFLIDIPADGNYIEILGHRIDGFESFEAFCEHLKKYAELEETVKSQRAEIEALKEAKEKAQATAAGVIKRQDAEIERLKNDLAKEFVCFVGSPHKVEHCPFFDELENERAEAIKETIEAIKRKSSSGVMVNNGIPVAGTRHYTISEVNLYEIEKEMVGE